MMNSRYLIPFLFLASTANAATMVFHASKLNPQAESFKQINVNAKSDLLTEVSFNLSSLDYNPKTLNAKSFTDLKAAGLELTANEGEPALPFHAIVVPGTPADIEVNLDLGSEEMLSDVVPAPAQKQKCRCELDKKLPFMFKAKAYKQVSALYRIESMGDFRGQAYSRVILSPVSYDGMNKSLSIYPNLKVSVISRDHSKKNDVYKVMKEEVASAYDYLIISPKALQPGLENFLLWKRKLGHVINLVSLEDIGATSAQINKFIHDEYAKNKFTYAMLVGSEKIFPTNYLSTSGGSRTPSDSSYFIMGDATDFIPDVYHSRLVAESLEDVKNQTGKWIAYESAETVNQAGFTKMIGIASNEGSGPSDNEYVQSIEKRFADKVGATASHFYQNNANSSTAGINAAFNAGAFWTVYMGHGDGSAWPSTNSTYNVNSIAQMDNAAQVKPVLIDVACQNGKLLKGHFGERMANVSKDGLAMGVTAYYGGSVNISWHPPAILARGVVYKYFDKNLTTLGESIFAGHLYLAENFSKKDELIWNYRWFHLFGDPSLRLRDRAPIASNSALSVKALGENRFQLLRDGAALAKATITLFDEKEENSLLINTDEKGEFGYAEQKVGFTHFYHWVKNQGLSKYTL